MARLRLRELREARRLTLEDVGTGARVGSASTVARHEGWGDPAVKQQREPTLDDIAKYARFYGTTVSYIVRETDEPGPAGRNSRSRLAVKQELERIDLLSVRVMREMLAAMPGAPSKLIELEDCARALRAELAAAP